MISPRPDLDLVAFDLDNTLYDEGQYFSAAFAVIAPALAARCGTDAGDIARRLEAVLRAKGRHYHHLFNDVLAELGLEVATELPGVLERFRSVRAALIPFPGVEALLADLGRRYRLGLITSGMRAVQENKIGLLGVGAHFAHIVFSSTLSENKPGRLPFQTLLDAVGVTPARAAYVGDNPLVDFRGANDLGMLTVRVRNPEFDAILVTEGSDARIRIERVTELRALLL